MTVGGSAQPAVLLPGAVQVQRHLGKSFPFFSYFRVEKKIPEKIAEHRKILCWQHQCWEDGCVQAARA